MLRLLSIVPLSVLAMLSAVGSAMAEDADKTFNLEARKARLPWIWQVPQQQSVPEAAGKTEVDRFINAALAKHGITPAGAADDLTWLRRVYFALTGLPPSWEQMNAFRQDGATDRRERVLDALLAAPQFGERWARHWMDLMRYAETRGHESDFHIANAWRYRDYLIRAFNADVPYDRFVAEHLAGDLLLPRLDAAGANESVQATGWAFLGEENHSPVDIRLDECERIDNKVDVLSKSFLGLTVACARCHDHKFDAISQQDYYALSGFMLGSPFRQARFETMEQHRAAAVKLDELRKKLLPPLAVELARVARPAVERMADQLLAARKILFGATPDAAWVSLNLPANQSTAWVEQLKLAVHDKTHPLHAFAMLAHEPDVERADKFPALLAKCTPAPFQLPQGARVLADYTQADATAWKTDGPTFGTRAARSGDLLWADGKLRVQTHGAAMRDPFWNRLALTPGTEMDSGSLGAAARAGKTLLTPKFTLTAGRLHYLLRGKAEVYAGVDSHIMITGPLHGGLVAKFDTGNQFRWVTHDLTNYAGHRAHLEFSPQADSVLEVLMVVESAAAPDAFPVAPWQWQAGEISFVEVAGRFQQQVQGALYIMSQGGRLTQQESVLADWVMGNLSLLGIPDLVQETAAAAYVKAVDELGKSMRWDSAIAVSMGDGTGVDDQILKRGKPTSPGANAPRSLPAAFGLSSITTVLSSGRLELAGQIANAENPLLARVVVNRVWHHLFGRGIVPTVDNFGYLGERPSHPELLDHLAWQFSHGDGWSLKRLLRKLVLTDVFARSSQTGDASSALEADPTNIYLHHMPVVRLEGEAIRDALLVASGRINLKALGPPVPVHLTEFVIGRGRPDVSGPLDGSGRRSIYTAVRRNFLPSMMLAFDFPTPFTSMGRRNVTNVPAQSLVMLNDPFIQEQCSVWARRLDRELPSGTDEVRIVRLFETAYSRPPSAAELKLSLESLAELRSLDPAATPAAVWQDFIHGIVQANEFIYLR